MIVSASRRTDIPAYYTPWLMNRLRAGSVLMRNPMNHAQLSRVSLAPEVVDCIVFWTKDAANLLPHLDEIDRLGYRYYFQFTLTPYGRGIETNLRPKEEIENTFIELAKRIGKERIVWRYDPILLNEAVTVDDHRVQFRRMCEKLTPYADALTLSFVDIYPKLKSAPIRKLTDAEVAELAAFIGETAKEHGLPAAACCEAHDLAPYGIARASCIDKARIEKVLGYELDLPADPNQRPGCGCSQSIDIGAYNTCANGCVYCYANDSLASAKRRNEAHDPAGELLIGTVAPGETIVERAIRSNRKAQLGWF